MAIEINGSLHFGTIEVDGDTVTLTSLYGSSIENIGTEKPHKVARAMLGKLVQQHLART